MNYWAFSDSHLGHDTLRERLGIRADSDERLLTAIRKNVRQDDVLISFGDVAFKEEKLWHERIAEAAQDARRWMLRGNHDKKSYSWYLNYWHFVGEEIVLKIFGKKILLTHEPQTGNFFDLNIHGHLHTGDHRGQVGTNGFCLCSLGADRPLISLREICERRA